MLLRPCPVENLAEGTARKNRAAHLCRPICTKPKKLVGDMNIYEGTTKTPQYCHTHTRLKQNHVSLANVQEQ